MRAHFRTAIQDAAGDLLANSVISVYVNGTNGSQLLGSPIYSDGTSSNLLSNPFSTPDGNVSFYLASPTRVDLGVLPQGGQPVFIADVDVNINQSSSAQLNFPGSAANTTQLGSGATATNTQAVAFGDSSSAGGTQATADGQGAVASGNGSTAVGQAAQATALSATAVGQGTQSSAVTGTAVGQGASVAASATHSTAIGAGATAQNPNQIVLGTSADDVYVPGGLVHSQTASPQALVNSSTITYTGAAQVPVTCAGSVTGIILAAVAAGSGGSGQTLTVINESANTITFAIAGTSNVADGVSDIIAALTSRTFVWDGHTSLWYRMA